MAIAAKGKKGIRRNFCDPCSGKSPSDIQDPLNSTANSHRPPDKNDIIMDLYGIKDSVDMKLSTTVSENRILFYMTTKVILGYTLI